MSYNVARSFVQEKVVEEGQLYWLSYCKKTFIRQASLDGWLERYGLSWRSGGRRIDTASLHANLRTDADTFRMGEIGMS